MRDHENGGTFVGKYKRGFWWLRFAFFAFFSSLTASSKVEEINATRPKVDTLGTGYHTSTWKILPIMTW